MRSPLKTAIVTVASQGIGAGIVKALVARGFNVVANSRKMTQSTEVAASNQVALVDGHIGELWHRLFGSQRPSLAPYVRGIMDGAMAPEWHRNFSSLGIGNLRGFSSRWRAARDRRRNA